MPILIDPQGVARDVPSETVAAAIERGWRPQTHADVLSAAGAAASEADYGGIHGAIGAAGAGLARGASLGLSDVAARALGGDDAAATLSGLRENNPAISAGSELVGAIAPALLSGGGSAPASLASAAGRGAAEGLGRGLLAKAAGGAVEGAIYGAGAGVSELALSQDPLTWERAASTLSSNALYGAGIGGGVGLAGAGLEHGLVAAKRAIDARLAAHATELASAQVGADIAALDKGGLKAARDAEIEAIDGARAPARQQFVDDLTEYRRLERDANLNAATKGAAERDAREAGAKLRTADMRVRSIVDDPIGLAEKPERALGPLQRQQHALEEALKARAAAEAAFEAAPETIRADILAGKVRGERGPFNAAGMDLAVDREMTRRFGAAGKPLEAAELTAPQIQEVLDYAKATGNTGLQTSAAVALGGEGGNEIAQAAAARGRQHVVAAFNEIHPPAPRPLPPNLAALEKIPALLEKNLALQRQLGELTAVPTSERLAQIDAAHELLTAPAKAPTLAERLLHRVPGAGLVSEIAGLGGKAMGGLRAAVGKAARRTGEAVSSFAGAAAPAVGKAVPIATRILSELSYTPGQARSGSHADTPSAPGPSRLPELYRARTDEVKRLTAYDETGAPRLRPEIRQHLADRLQPIRVVDPILGDQLEQLAARRIEYLSSLIPRQPDLGGVHTGPANWHPSDMEMRSWARSAHAAEDPGGVEERVANGTVTPEDAAAYWAVYPERARHYQQQVMAALPTLTKALPYAKRLALGIFTGLPVDPSMNPRVLAMLQGQFPAEPGTAGGTQAPKANPQFGSIKKSADAPTPAQSRAQGARP